jgi:hypothetical protein
MWLTETSDYLSRNANEVCFSLAMLISLLFYRQYKKYEAEAEREEMVDQFLRNCPLSKPAPDDPSIIVPGMKIQEWKVYHQ